MKVHRSLLVPGLIAVILALGACGTSAVDIEVGDCYGATDEEVGSVNVVPCEQAHVYEAFAVFDYPGDDNTAYPGGSTISTHANTECVEAFEPYVGKSYESSELFLSTLTPTEEGWDAGDHEIVCSLRLEDESELTGSQRGSNR